MLEFPGPDHPSCLVVEQGEARRVAARINLHPQRRRPSVDHRPLQDEGEGEAPRDGGISRGEQPPRRPWMHGSERVLLGVHHEHPGHLHASILLLPVRASACAGKVPLAKDSRRFPSGGNGTGSNPVRLFNRCPQRRGLRCHPLVPLQAPLSEPPFQRAQAGQVQACYEQARSRQAPGLEPWRT